VERNRQSRAVKVSADGTSLASRAGAALLRELQNANGHGWQWSLFTCLLVSGAMFVPRAIHNRRVARTD